MVTLRLDPRRRAIIGAWSSVCCSGFACLSLEVLAGAVADLAAARPGMQTIPIFAYLVPILFFFGFGPTAAIDRYA